MSIPSESNHEPGAEGDATFPSTPAQQGDHTPAHESLPEGSPLDLTDSGPAPDATALTADHAISTSAPQELEATPASAVSTAWEESTRPTEPPDPNTEPSDPDKIVSIPEDVMGERTEPEMATAFEMSPPPQTTSAPETGEHSAAALSGSSEEAAPAGMDAAEAAESIIPDLDLAPGDDTVTHAWPGHAQGAEAAPHPAASVSPMDASTGENTTSSEETGHTGAGLAAGIVAAVGAGLTAAVGSVFSGRSHNAADTGHDDTGHQQEESARAHNIAPVADAAAAQDAAPPTDSGTSTEEEYGGPPPDLDEGAAEAAWEPDAPVSQDFDKTWQRIEDAHKQKTTLSAMVVDRVKGGLVVDIGMQGFVPASQVASGKIHDLERFIGRPLKLRITDLDRERQRVVLSARIVQEEEHLRRKRETMERLKVGLITDGVVRRLTDFGAFVDIGGTDGLLHVSEMSWSRVKHPKEVVSPGEHVKVKVLKISDDRKKISLGMRQLLPDPWNGIETQYKVGEMVSGRVVRVVPFGAFIQVKDGVDAILPNTEVSARKPKTEDLPQIGDTINAKVIEVRPEARRMTLSLRRIQEEQERKEYRDHVQTTTQTARKTTIGDM
nr:S1 RNA-binding domain-containing protein [Armatimonadota bacterium]